MWKRIFGNRKVTGSAQSARPIGADEAAKLGVTTPHEEMANGERRFRLRSRDGTAYIRTEATNNSGWQKSHFHNSVKETYIVQVGRMALVELVNDALRARVLSVDEIVTTQPLVPHNVYLFPDAIIHTVKHGVEGNEKDWHGHDNLDANTRHMSEAEILRLAEEG